MKNYFLLLLIILVFPAGIFAQAASLSDGDNTYFYATINEAFEAAAASGEITLLENIILEAPLIVGDNKHIILVSDASSVTIQRSVNNIDYPLIWITGMNVSLTLGKPGMDNELIIDGGNLNEPPILARAPLITINGRDSKLIMHDKVTLQNNHNTANVPTTHNYQNGAAVFIHTINDDFTRQAEFIMKGGTIRGNLNNVKSYAASGGGVCIIGFGVFTMEGGVIADNYAHFSGGGFFSDGRGSFKKTGGIIYGAEAPQGLRNFARLGNDIPRSWPVTYGHAVCIISGDYSFIFRDNTVKENETHSFTSAASEGKWETSKETSRRTLLIIILSSLLFCVSVFLIIMRVILKKENKPHKFDISKFDLSAREKEIFKLLLTDSPIKNIAKTLDITVSGIRFHSDNLYAKLGVKNRIELFAKYGRKTQEPFSKIE